MNKNLKFCHTKYAEYVFFRPPPIINDKIIVKNN